MTQPAKTLHCRDCGATVDADRRELTRDWAHEWERGSRDYPAGRMVHVCPACRPGGVVVTKARRRR